MKIPQITFTRFIAAISIVLFHYGGDLLIYKVRYIAEIISKANIGVSYFFILSGFIMIVAYHSKTKINPFDFYKNRFARIYPMYVVGLLLFLIFNSDVNILTVLGYLFGVQSWVSGKVMVLNFPGWSISVEFFFYLIFPFLYNNIYSKQKKWIVWVVIGIWFATQLFSNYFVSSTLYEGRISKSHDFIYYFPLLHLNEFLIGNLAGIYFIKNCEKKNYDWAILSIFIMILLSLLFIPLYYHNGLMGIFFIPLIILISMNNGFLTKMFSLKPLEYLGEISYAIYILHIPVLYILKSYLSENKWFFAIYISILIILSGILYQFIEKPLRDKIKKLR